MINHRPGCKEAAAAPMVDGRMGYRCDCAMQQSAEREVPPEEWTRERLVAEVRRRKLVRIASVSSGVTPGVVADEVDDFMKPERYRDRWKAAAKRYRAERDDLRDRVEWLRERAFRLGIPWYAHPTGGDDE